MRALAVLVTLGALCLGDGIPIAERVCASELPLPLSRPEIGLIEPHNFSLKNPGKISFPGVMPAKDIIKLKIDPNPDDGRNSGLFIAQRRSPQHRSIVMLLAGGYTDAAHFSPIRAKLLFGGDTGPQRSDELDSRMPEKVSGGRLAGILCKNSDQRRFASADGLRHEQSHSYFRYIDVGSDLGFADPASFGDGIGHVAGLSNAASPSDNPQPDGGDGQDASKSDKPRGKICDGIASCLFPKAIILDFLTGALVGCGIVAWAVYQGQCDKNPKRKRN